LKILQQKAQTKQDKRKIISSRSQVISKDKRDLNDYKVRKLTNSEIFQAKFRYPIRTAMYSIKLKQNI